MSEKKFVADQLMWGSETVTETDVTWYDAKDKPFRLFGLLHDPHTGGFCRLPREVAEATNQGVLSLYANPSGGRLRFATDSDYIILRVTLPRVERFDHMPMTGVCGFDLYEDSPEGTESEYIHTFRPFPHMTDGFVSVVRFKEHRMRRLTLNFPLYNEVERLELGLADSATLAEGIDYRNQKPVIFYGSSITQGGCASRPGNSYAAMACRALNLDYVNLGFSGSGKAEDAITRYMADLGMSVFVSDYDHNAPNAEYLRETHERMYRTIREKHPHVPYIMMTHPAYSKKCPGNKQSEERGAIIRETYEKARSEGDEQVYFLDGNKFFPKSAGDSCTVDATHPNDLGFYFMAQAILPILKEIFKA